MFSTKLQPPSTTQTNMLGNQRCNERTLW